MSDLPAGWREVGFESVFTDVTGGQTKTKTRDYKDSGVIPIVDQGRDLIGGYTDDLDAVFRGPLPVVGFGDHTKVVKYIDFGFGIGADGLKVLRPSAEVDPRFGYRVLHSLRLPAGGYDRHFKYLKRAKIKLPPLGEQRRIAAILDKADELRIKRRRTLEQLDALTGALFADLLGDGYSRAVSVRDVPDHRWPRCLLMDVATLATGHTPDRDKPEYWNGDVPWVSLTEIRQLDGKVAETTDLSVTERGLSNSSAVELPAGTVCFSRTASVGFVTVMGRPMATSQDFVNWVCDTDQLDPLYLMHALRASRPSLLALSSGSTHRTIYMRVAERFMVALPPIDLQRQFARRIRSLDMCRVSYSDAAATGDDLFASLQSRAFRGEL